MPPRSKNRTTHQLTLQVAGDGGQVHALLAVVERVLQQLQEVEQLAGRADHGAEQVHLLLVERQQHRVRVLAVPRVHHRVGPGADLLFHRLEEKRGEGENQIVPIPLKI